MKSWRRSILAVAAAWLAVGCLACSAPGSPPGGTAGAASPSPVAASSGAGKVVVYTPFPFLTANALAEAFTRKTGIEVEQVREGTSKVFARLRAERYHPRADVWYSGGGMIPFMTAAREGLLEPYKPTGFEGTPVSRGNLVVRDPEWRWVGMAVLALGYCYNPQKLSERDLPRQWSDLVDPKWRHQLEMWDPAESGTSVLFLEAALLRAVEAGQGEEAGWKYLTAFFGNLKRYTREGTPAFAVARGESLIGIHFEHQFLEFLAEQAGDTQVADVQANLRWYLPPSSPVLSDPAALVKGGPNPEAGRKFIDFLLSTEGQRIVNRFCFSIDPSLPPPANLQGITMDELMRKAMKLEPEWMAENYDRVRRTWQDEVEVTAEE